MDIPALRQGQGWVAVRLGAGKGADLVEEAAEACSRAERVEPPCHEVGPIREVPQVGQRDDTYANLPVPRGYKFSGLTAVCLKKGTFLETVPATISASQRPTSAVV
jgi:hypothetical protein